MDVVSRTTSVAEFLMEIKPQLQLDRIESRQLSNNKETRPNFLSLPFCPGFVWRSRPVSSIIVFAPSTTIVVLLRVVPVQRATEDISLC